MTTIRPVEDNHKHAYALRIFIIQTTTTHSTTHDSFDFDFTFAEILLSPTFRRSELAVVPLARFLMSQLYIYTFSSSNGT